MAALNSIQLTFGWCLGFGAMQSYFCEANCYDLHVCTALGDTEYGTTNMRDFQDIRETLVQK